MTNYADRIITQMRILVIVLFEDNEHRQQYCFIRTLYKIVKRKFLSRFVSSKNTYKYYKLYRFVRCTIL